MKRTIIVACLALTAVLVIAGNSFAGTWICSGTVKHDGVAYQGAIIKIYKDGCLAQTKTDTTGANGYFCVPTSLPAGNYVALITNAPHLNWVSFYYNGSGYPTDLGIIELYSGQAAMEDCRD